MWLREQTALPIVLKGILHPDDARAAVDAGVDGIVVSNHGGRQVDGAIASLDALPGVLEAVGGAIPVLLDSGVRTGADVVKAVALGAAAMLYGRPYVYGLGLGGQAGVEHVLRCLLGEMDVTMALSGAASLADLGPDVLPGGEPDQSSLVGHSGVLHCRDLPYRDETHGRADAIRRRRGAGRVRGGRRAHPGDVPRHRRDRGQSLRHHRRRRRVPLGGPVDRGAAGLAARGPRRKDDGHDRGPRVARATWSGRSSTSRTCPRRPAIHAAASGRPRISSAATAPPRPATSSPPPGRRPGCRTTSSSHAVPATRRRSTTPSRPSPTTPRSARCSSTWWPRSSSRSPRASWPSATDGRVDRFAITAGDGVDLLVDGPELAVGAGDGHGRGRPRHQPRRPAPVARGPGPSTRSGLVLGASGDGARRPGPRGRARDVAALRRRAHPVHLGGRPPHRAAARAHAPVGPQPPGPRVRRHARHAHRPGQPPGVRRPARRDRQAGRGRGGRAVHRPRRLQAGQRRASGTSPATTCCRWSAIGSAGPCGPATWWPASAATSSRCCASG